MHLEHNERWEHLKGIQKHGNLHYGAAKARERSELSVAITIPAESTSALGRHNYLTTKDSLCARLPSWLAPFNGIHISMALHGLILSSHINYYFSFVDLIIPRTSTTAAMPDPDCPRKPVSTAVLNTTRSCSFPR